MWPISRSRWRGPPPFARSARNRGELPRLPSPRRAGGSAARNRSPTRPLEVRARQTRESAGGRFVSRELRAGILSDRAVRPPALYRRAAGIARSYWVLCEYALRGLAVVAFAQQSEEIGYHEKGRRRREQEPANDGAGQRRILFLTWPADCHRNHADDHGGCRHQHRP